LKNLNSVRIQAKVWVDGKDATEGTWLIVMPHSHLELERYITNGNFQRGNRFKFIERTKEIEDHRGIGSDDGLIRIEYKTEQVIQDVPLIRYYDVPYPNYYPPPPPRWPGRRRSDLLPHYPVRSRGLEGMGSPSTCFNATVSYTTGSSAPVNAMAAPGITVPGSESNQQFVSANDFPTLAQSDVIVLQLRGCVEGQRVENAVTVDYKPKCVTCGRVNRAGNQ